MVKTKSDFVQDIINGGNFLIERADDIIGNTDKYYGIEITLELYPNEVPTINVEKMYYNYKGELVDGE